MRVPWPLWLAALVVGVGGGAGVALAFRSDATAKPPSLAIVSAPVATWKAGARRAPAFSLTDQDGRPLSLASLRGRPVIVTFIDPLCRNLCPLEASVLSTAVSRLPASGPRPAIIAVSVDPWADTRQNFAEDAQHWHLAPGWLWGTASEAVLSPVWKHYAIGVVFSTRRIAGIDVREITHTEAAYLIDSAGNERALFVWPFTASDVLSALRPLLVKPAPQD